MRRFWPLGIIFTLFLVAAGKPQRHAVFIDDMAYSPASISISVGDTVVWKNGDERDHTVAADDGSFRSANIPPGGNFSYTFKKAGSYAYGCKYHPRMRGNIKVVE